MNTFNNYDVVFDPRTETFIPINNNNNNNNDNVKPIDENERVIWTFTLGIPIDATHGYEPEKQTEKFENAVFEMTKEITKITDGLTYEYCYGMCLRRNQGSLEIPPLLNENDNNDDNINHNLSVRISIIVLPEIANDIYNFVKNIISKVNKKYELGLLHVQAMKTSGTAHHLSF